MRCSIWKCPTCKSSYKDYDDAIKCRNKHYPPQQEWWFCKCGYGIKLDGISERSVRAEINNHIEVACNEKVRNLF